MWHVRRAILRLEHWQAFLVVVSLLVLLGYPLYLVCRSVFGWMMPFIDSPAPAIVLYLCYGFWFDAVLAIGGKAMRFRTISALLLIAFACVSLWLRKDRPAPDFAYIAPLFLLVILWLLLVLIPTAKVVRSVRSAPGNELPFWADVVLIAAYFPFGLWVLQPRLNRAQ